MVEHRKSSIRPSRFVPDTRLVITSAFRTSGLLAALSDRDARTLLAVVTFFNAGGRFTGTAPGIAGALGVPEKQVRERLQSLMALSFQGAPVLVELPREQALPIYIPGPHILRHVEEEEESTGEAGRVATPPATVLRETLVSASRERYGRPRSEVERVIASQLGHSPLESEDSAEGNALRGLLSVGVTRDEAARLLGAYPVEEIQNQLDWLPQRDARSPARFVVAAVENRYAPPVQAREPGEFDASEKP